MKGDIQENCWWKMVQASEVQKHNFSDKINKNIRDVCKRFGKLGVFGIIQGSAVIYGGFFG